MKIQIGYEHGDWKGILIGSILGGLLWGIIVAFLFYIGVF